MENVMQFLFNNPNSSSTQIQEGLYNKKSIATIKRELAYQISLGNILQNGKGKNTTYIISNLYKMNYEVNLDTYFCLDIDERKISTQFNFEFIANQLNETEIFTAIEKDILINLQQQFITKLVTLSANQYKKEFERLAIDLSWKSSQIEGNTYSLLETEELIKNKKEATGKTKEEATMLLNHKEVLDFMLDNKDFMKQISVAKIEDIHSILIQELMIDRNIRTRGVGISGTNYKPIDNQFQIKEALDLLCQLINNKKFVFDKAFIALIIIAYIQPFADGNKRTSRIVSNALLMSENHCPISYRTINNLEYKKAMLLVYELQNISAIKKMFIDQYRFAVENYF